MSDGPEPDNSDKRQRESGQLKHLGITLPDSFFDPLPEEELALWEGDGEPLLPPK